MVSQKCQCPGRCQDKPTLASVPSGLILFLSCGSVLPLSCFFSLAVFYFNLSFKFWLFLILGITSSLASISFRAFNSSSFRFLWVLVPFPLKVFISRPLCSWCLPLHFSRCCSVMGWKLVHRCPREILHVLNHHYLQTKETQNCSFAASGMKKLQWRMTWSFSRW